MVCRGVKHGWLIPIYDFTFPITFPLRVHQGAEVKFVVLAVQTTILTCPVCTIKATGLAQELVVLLQLKGKVGVMIFTPLWQSTKDIFTGIEGYKNVAAIRKS